MNKFFNVSGSCKPSAHYMVDLTQKLTEIKKMVDRGEYFTINRARQYGKTTTLHALRDFLAKEYEVVSLDFQLFSHANFQNEQAFVTAFSSELLECAKEIPQEVQIKLHLFTNSNFTLLSLFRTLSKWCALSKKPVVLMIDEADSAANNQVFLDFLAQLRGYYLNRDQKPTFHSVILAGVYDIKNRKYKFRTDDYHRENSPWNIAADFLVDMSFSTKEITDMLMEYDKDHRTNMRVAEMSRLIYDYTSGYPYLVSCLCKFMDERDDCSFTKEGFLSALRILLTESNTLFDSLLQKLKDFPELDAMLRSLLFTGKEIAYAVGVHSVEIALLFGFVKISNNHVQIANRIFETLLYNLFLAIPKIQQETLYNTAQKEKPLFAENGRLHMTRILERFVIHFDALYGDRGQTFYEEEGRRYFMLFLKPIINGIGNCYVEAETRNRERTDLIVDYGGEQFVIETKVWHGAARHRQGEEQLANYLEHYHLERGYLLTFNFNQQKEIGVKEVLFGDKVLVEAVV